MPFTTSLFQQEPLSKYLSERRDAARRTVNDIGTLKDLSAKEFELREMYKIAIPKLLRSRARFGINVTADGIAVTITVDCRGDLRLLSVKPDSAGSRDAGLEATIYDERWGSNDGGPISLVKIFTSPTTAHAVKIWAKTEIDTIEGWLSDMVPQVHMYNRQIDEFMASVIEHRRAVLASAENLRAELGFGI